MPAYRPAAGCVGPPWLDIRVLPQFTIGAAAEQAVLALSAARVGEESGVPDGVVRAYFVLADYSFCLWWD